VDLDGPTSRLLTDGAVRSDCEGETWLVAVAGRGGVLDQPHVIRQHVSRDCTGRILVARVLIVHSKRDARVDGHIRERDLVSIWMDWLQRDAREAAPARMRVSRADAADARLRSGRKIGSSGRRTMNTTRTVAVVEPDGGVGDDGPFDSSQPSVARPNTTAIARR
jgi:hypothetical protein